MRKHQQQQILEVLQTIQMAQAEGLYADCQDGALGVGEYIESIEGEGTKTVALLEDYCELLFKASNGQVGENALKKHLIKIENSVKSELKPNRIEIAFLSYNASMSDSIESIYLAAKEDPDCDVYWIPIPFYDKNPDGSFGTMHYEGADCYGDYIECTDFRDYDIDSRHPDVIFTFSPYDTGNHVTSVHPDYYCSRLRGLTDLLVYVPYFVAVDNVSEHFCTVAGCVYAHKVIVQSEKIRQTYIRVFRKEYGDKLGKPEDKFVALGSPKFDKVINTRREDCELPDEWRKIIGDKKVILYNTSVGSILRGNEQYLIKQRHVLDTFRNQDDIVLWWRPHPLSEHTYDSMRPKLAGEYHKIVAEYKSEGWGIYDDTADLHRAIAWSDAYFGDWSSLVSMYGTTGKPIVIQSIENTEKKLPIQLWGFTIDDQGLCWGFDLLKDCLYELDFTTDTARIVALSNTMPYVFGKEHLFYHRYIMTHSIGGKIICAPYYLYNYLVYNRKNGEIEEVDIDRNYLMSADSEGFAIAHAVEYDGKVYFFGSNTKAIVVFCNVDNSLDYNTRVFEKIGFYSDDGQYVKHPIYLSSCSEDGKITTIMRGSDKLIRYCLPTQDLEIISSSPVLEQCVCAEFDGKHFWLITNKYDKLVRWDPHSHQTVEYHISLRGNIPDCYSIFSGISDCGDFLLLFPGSGDVLIRFDKGTGHFDEYPDLPTMSSTGVSVYEYEPPKRINDKTYAFARFNYTIYELDRVSGTITPHRFYLDKDSSDTFREGLRKDISRYTGSEIHECFSGDTAEFFADLLHYNNAGLLHRIENQRALITNADGTAGKAIYGFAKKMGGSI